MIRKTIKVLLAAITLAAPTLAVAQDDLLIPAPPWHTTDQCYQAALHWARMHAPIGSYEYYRQFNDYFYANYDFID